MHKNQHSPIARGGAQEATQHMAEVVEKLAKPAGFAALTIEQRKFLLSVLLGSVVPADGKVKDVEMQRLELLLAGKMRTTGAALSKVLHIARLNIGSNDMIKSVAGRLPDLFGIEDRCNLIGMLWELALCDHELHAREEALIYAIADEAHVPRKKVAEQQAKANSKAP
jgi:uncharacterized tellurite resistance protein B-like protein